MDADITETEPNQMSEIYRNYRPASVPLQIEKHLQFLEISNDGHMLCGSCCLCGRYWTGSLWYTEQVTTSTDKDNYLSGIDLSSSICTGKFLESNTKVAVGEDNGSISILEVTELESNRLLHFVPQVTAYDHDGPVLSISVSPDKQRLVSGSMDMCVKIWDIGEGLVTHFTFRPAHTHLVTHVEHSPSNNDVFISCSLDGCALLWDIRQTKPATVLIDASDEGLTSGSWKLDDENIFAIGTNFGNVSLIDIRMNSTVGQTQCFNRPVHRLCYNERGILAACGDTHIVKALQSKSDTLDVIYSSDSHSDFVRGLAWHPKTQILYSCGWDKQILSHSINGS